MFRRRSAAPEFQAVRSAVTASCRLRNQESQLQSVHRLKAPTKAGQVSRSYLIRCEVAGGRVLLALAAPTSHAVMQMDGPFPSFHPIFVQPSAIAASCSAVFRASQCLLKPRPSTPARCLASACQQEANLAKKP